MVVRTPGASSFLVTVARAPLPTSTHSHKPGALILPEGEYFYLLLFPHALLCGQRAGYHTTSNSYTTIQQSISIWCQYLLAPQQVSSNLGALTCTIKKTLLLHVNSQLVESDLEESWADCCSRPAVATNCSKEHSFSLSTIQTTSSSTEWANLWSASRDWAKHLWWFSFSHFFMIATGGRGGTAMCSPCLKRGSLSHKTQPKERK